jgi:hypothetical protein
MSAELKIKIKSLAEEARIIRAEERKAKERGASGARASLHEHRVLHVRPEQRATLIAYGYLRGRAYRQLEASPRYKRAPFDRPGPHWEKVAHMVRK